MNEWSLEVKKAENGYVCKYNEENDAGERVEKFIAIESEETSDYDDLRAMQRLLREIKDYFGVLYQKHNKVNLSIQLVDTETDKPIDEE